MHSNHPAAARSRSRISLSMSTIFGIDAIGSSDHMIQSAQEHLQTDRAKDPGFRLYP
jgi:hypothetical protein